MRLGGTVLALDGGTPGNCGLHRVTGAPVVHVGQQAHGGDLLHGLVGGTIFSQADGVVGVDEDGLDTHERRHAQGIARVLGEHEESAAEGNEAAVQRHTVHDGGHAELAHPVGDVVAICYGIGDGPRLGPGREVGGGQVGGTAQEFGQRLGIGGDRLLRGLAGGRALCRLVGGP